MCCSNILSEEIFMSQIKCPECGKVTSSKYKKCSGCGSELPRGSGCLARLVFALVIIAVIIYLLVASGKLDLSMLHKF